MFLNKVSQRKTTRIIAAAMLVGLISWALLDGRVPGFGHGHFDAAWRHNTLRILPGLSLLIAFGIYWGIAAKDRAKDQTPEAAWSAYLQQALVALSLFLIVGRVPGLTTRILPESISLVLVGSQ